MDLSMDVRRFLRGCQPAASEGAEDRESGEEIDLRRLPWGDGTFAAIELDDVPDPSEWVVSGPALNEVRRVLKSNGLLEIRTRRRDAQAAQATQKQAMGALTRLLQNHGFDLVSVDEVDDEGAMISAMALRADGPEDSCRGLEGECDSAANRAVAMSLDARGVEVRVRVIFDVLSG